MEAVTQVHVKIPLKERTDTALHEVELYMNSFILELTVNVERSLGPKLSTDGFLKISIICPS